MSSASTNSTRSILRGILRQLKVRTDKVDNTKQNTMRKFVLGQYRAAAAAATPTDQQQQQKQQQQQLAKEYLKLRIDLQERSRLHALDTGAEVQLSGHELSRRAAARAGLQLPDLDPQLQKDVPTPSPSSSTSKP
jgi:hypothetical protein